MKASIVENDNELFAQALCFLRQAFKVGFDMLRIATFFKYIVLELLSVLGTRQTANNVDTSSSTPVLRYS